MQKYTVFVGIDMSKQWFDASLFWTGYTGQQLHDRFRNEPKGFASLLKWVGKQARQHQRQGSYYVCMEHTGAYSLALSHFLKQQKVQVVTESPLRIARCSGLRRGKSDKADAAAIARYAERFHEQILARPVPTGVLLQVQALLSLRSRLVRYTHGLGVAANELAGCVPANISQPVAQHSEPACKLMRQQTTLVDKLVKQLIFSDPELKRLYELITSVIGIGPVIAAYLLLYTNAFTAFEKARQFACYIGVAPFGHQSGSSVHQPDQVSFLANQRIKALISTAATVAIRFDPEMKAFAKKHRARGKEKGWIYNAVKNKVVHRIFAVVKRGTPYVALAKHQA